MIVPAIGEEPIIRSEKREIGILVASEGVTITRAVRSGRAGGRPARSPRAHRCLLRPRGCTDPEIGREATTFTVSSGGFVAAPPGYHSVRNDSDRPARWLTIHARRGFAAFARPRDAVEVEWDISTVPPDGGLPASEAIIRP